MTGPLLAIRDRTLQHEGEELLSLLKSAQLWRVTAVPLHRLMLKSHVEGDLPGPQCFHLVECGHVDTLSQSVPMSTLTGAVVTGADEPRCTWLVTSAVAVLRLLAFKSKGPSKVAGRSSTLEAQKGSAHGVLRDRSQSWPNQCMS
jgi:hypothetical protein